MVALLLAPALPLFCLAVVVGLRRPVWLLAAYAAVLPWGSGFALPVGLPPTFSSLSTLAGLLASAGLVAHLAVTRRRAPVLLPALPAWLCFAALALLTATWSVDLPLTLEELPVLGSLVALYTVSALTAATPDDVRTLEVGIATGGVVAGLWALAALATGTLPRTGAGVPRFELPAGGGENGDPNITAAILLLPLAVAAARALDARHRGGRAAWTAAAALPAAAVALTASRGGMLGAAVVLGTLLWRRPARTVAAVAAVPVLLGVLVFAAAPADLREHVFVTGSSGRTGVWEIGAAACLEHCAVGSGWGTFPDVHEQVLLSHPEATGNRLRFVAHNAWLQVAVEAGLLALVAVVVAIVTTIRDLTRLPRRVRAAPLAGLFGLLVTNSLLSNLDFKYFWLVHIYAAVVLIAHHPHLVVSAAHIREDAAAREVRRGGR